MCYLTAGSAEILLDKLIGLIIGPEYKVEVCKMLRNLEIKELYKEGEAAAIIRSCRLAGWRINSEKNTKKS